MYTKNKDVETAEEVKPDKGPTFGIRHLQVALMFLNLAIGDCTRTSLSVAIVAMTDNSTSPNPDVPTYDWDNKSVILSSFFLGYILQIFTGHLSNLYNTKWLLFSAMFINSSACIFIPLVAQTLGPIGIMVCRVVQGMSQAICYPSVHNLLGKWAPLDERSRFGTIAFAGPPFGTIVSMPLTGFIAASWIGWPITFYLFGAMGYIWCIMWYFLGADSPSVHPTITEKERTYIEDSLQVNENKQDQKVPWKPIFKSAAVWAIIIAMIGENWIYSTLLTEIPIYLSKVMDFDMKSNSLLSAAPYLASLIFGGIFGVVSDYIINNGYISRGNSRKLFNSIGAGFASAALLVLSFLPKEENTLSVSMLIVAVGINSAVFVGFQINSVDITPKFSGAIVGIANGTSQIFSVIAPLVVQFVVTDETDPSLWMWIFILAAAIYLISDIAFVIFASGEVQWWDNIQEEKTEPVDQYRPKLDMDTISRFREPQKA